MMPPWPRSVIAPRAAWVSRSTAVTSTSSMRLLGVDGVVEEPVLEAEAGVVDQQLDRPVAVGHPALDRASWPRSARSAGSTSTSTPYAARSSVGDGLQPLLVAGDEHQVVAAGGELAGELVADPGGGAGDEGGAGRGRDSRHAASKQVPARVRATRVRHDGSR